MNLHPRTGLAAGVVGLGLLAPAVAQAGVPVNLRIEGPKRTVFEGRLNVGVHDFAFTGERKDHACDGVSQGFGSRSVPTSGAALTLAAHRFGFALKGEWNDDFMSPTFARVGGQDVSFDSATGRYLAEFRNGTSATAGSCGERVRRGDDVLFAYSTGSEPLLVLHGRRNIRAGRELRLRVTAGGDPVEGARVGGALTGADGRATVGPFGRGYHDLKATKDGTVRSNRLRVCAGGCAPLGRITDIRDGHRFGRRAAPRRLRGVVEAAPSGLKAIRLRLTRRVHGRTTSFDGRRFRHGRRHTFRVHRRWDWSYRLPARLGRGRYVLDVLASDREGRRDRPERGRSRVVFSVR